MVALEFTIYVFLTKTKFAFKYCAIGYVAMASCHGLSQLLLFLPNGTAAVSFPCSRAPVLPHGALFTALNDFLLAR